jgi:Flagellar biosynthesis protein, FliO
MEVVLPIASSIFVIGLLSGLLLLARRAAGGKGISFRSPLQPRLFSFPRRLKAGGDDQKGLSVLTQVALTPSHRLHLLSVGGEKVLLCTFAQGCTVIPVIATKSDRVAPSAIRPEERSVG